MTPIDKDKMILNIVVAVLMLATMFVLAQGFLRTL